MEKLNHFELEIIKAIATNYPGLRSVIPELCVSKRELTGAGSFTDFIPLEKPIEIEIEDGSPVLNFDKVIEMPNIQYGLGSHLELKNGVPDFLEIYTYGSEYWDGSYSIFTFVDP